MKTQTWRDVVASLSGIWLGGVLLVAAVAKVYEPGAFVEQIRLEELDFLLPAAWIALAALALETGLGLALVLGVHHRLVLAASSLLTAFFLFLTGRNYWLVAQGLRDPEASCGCFGSLIERTPAEAFWQDLLLLVPPLLLLLWLRWPQRKMAAPIRSGVSAVAALVVAIATWVSPAMQFSEAAAAIAALETDRWFEPSAHFQLLIDGQPAPAAVLESQGQVGVLVLSDQLPGPVLVDPRSSQAQILDSSQVQVEGDNRLLPEEVSAARSIPFQIVAGNIVFTVEDHTFSLVTR